MLPADAGLKKQNYTIRSKTNNCAVHYENRCK